MVDGQSEEGVIDGVEARPSGPKGACAHAAQVAVFEKGAEVARLRDGVVVSDKDARVRRGGSSLREDCQLRVPIV